MWAEMETALQQPPGQPQDTLPLLSTKTSPVKAQEILFQTDTGRCDLKKLNEVEVREGHRIKCQAGGQTFGVSNLL
jgi:hypothetical protein